MFTRSHQKPAAVPAAESRVAPNGAPLIRLPYVGEAEPDQDPTKVGPSAALARAMMEAEQSRDRESGLPQSGVRKTRPEFAVEVKEESEEDEPTLSNRSRFPPRPLRECLHSDSGEAATNPRIVEETVARAISETPVVDEPSVTVVAPRPTFEPPVPVFVFSNGDDPTLDGTPPLPPPVLPTMAFAMPLHQGLAWPPAAEATRPGVEWELLKPWLIGAAVFTLVVAGVVGFLF